MEVEKKYCFSCQTERRLEHFEEGFKSCKVCREKRKEYRQKKYYCDLCDFEGKLGCKAKHEKSQRHQAQLKRSQNPDIPKLPEPDEVGVDKNGKKYFVCKKCNVSVMYLYWERHIQTLH